MVERDGGEFDTPFAEWGPLLATCERYACLTGWRFVLSDFMHLQRRESAELAAARESALPMALEYADRVRACADACATGAAKPRLVTEFEACQRLVATEAVYNSMLATCTAVGLREAGASRGIGGPGTEMQPQLGGGADANAADDDDDAYAYHDMSQPIEVIARRLLAYDARLRASPELRDEQQNRVRQASFIVEFGLEHGLPEKGDATAEGTLKEFLERLGEWDGGKDNDMVRALVLGAIPNGPAERSLRSAVFDWFDNHKRATLIGGAVVGGLIGLAAAAGTVVIASRRSAR